ncbi:MAG: hypothetical protein ABIW38_05430 [Ferruginibacter sp.]
MRNYLIAALIFLPAFVFSQNVGIGTTTPTDKLEVFTADNSYGVTHSAPGIRVGTYIGGGGGWYGTSTNTPLYLYAYLRGTNALALYPNGNVGIGMNPPTEKLSVQTATNNYGLIHTDGNITLGTYLGGSTINGGWLGTKSNHPLMFYTNGNTTVMTLLQNGNVGIGTTTPNNSAQLEVASTSKGLLMPRMSSGQRTAIVSPAQGLQVYDTDTNSFWYFNGSGWAEMGSGATGTSYWAQDGSGTISNTNPGKILMGTNVAGPGYLNIKSTVNLSGIFMSETGINSADFLSAGIYAGGGTASTRTGVLLGNFGAGFTIANQANAPLTFQAYNAERMRITPTGYVGINTQTPTAQLEVKTATGFPGITHTDGTIRLTTLLNSATSAAFGTTSNHPLFFFTNNTFPPAVTISTSGNLGVGGSLASAKIEAFTADLQYGFLQTTSSGVRVGASAGGAGYYGTLSNHPLYLHANNGAAIVALLQNNNFGIGTTSPTERLTVLTATNNYGLNHTDGNVSLVSFVGGSGITAGWIGTKSNHPLGFFTNNGSAEMTLLQNGNVGIGTINPTYKLSVNGTIQTKEVRVQTGWADFVFEKNYKIQSLPEVEEFIVANKHLPGIPSAVEIERDGLLLGNIQTRMMQKIEELTLYAIEANKTIEELKKRLETIEKTNK